MKVSTWLGATALAIPVCLGAAEHMDTYQRTFQAGGPDRKLVVENVNGNVVVTGDSGADIRVTVRERWKASTQSELDAARRDIRVEMQQTGNTIRLFLDGVSGRRGREYRDIEFRHDFEVLVPRDTAIDLRTVNGSELRAQGTRGEFHLKNVNGAVDLIDAAGFGSAESLNGKVTARFIENPSKPAAFKTLNGAIDVAFQPNLSADLRMKSLNSDGFTDFDFASIPATGERGRKGQSRVVRVGAGGLEHSFETLNGDIRITRYGK